MKVRIMGLALSLCLVLSSCGSRDSGGQASLLAQAAGWDDTQTLLVIGGREVPGWRYLYWLSGACDRVREEYALSGADLDWQAAVGNGQVAAGTGQVAGNRQDSRRYYADRTPDPAFLQFLDTEDFDLRMECLKALEERVTQQELDSIYLVLDMKPEQGSLQEQLYAVRRFLTMQKRYDGSRLR